jgi:ABC-type multidrug transport system ATPase subunit
VLSVTALRKEYGTLVAVDGISFQVGRNEIVGLLGPNGAGKTTTLNMILGALQPTAGAIRIEDIDLATQRSRALGAGLAVLCVLLACWFFTRIYWHAVRTGLIARYSAETLN